MKLLERVGGAEAAGALVFGAGNAACFALEAMRGRPGPRRGAAAALALVNVALAAESALYLAVVPPGQGAESGIAGLAASTLALAATLCLFALTVRARGFRRTR